MKIIRGDLRPPPEPVDGWRFYDWDTTVTCVYCQTGFGATTPALLKEVKRRHRETCS